MFSRLIELGFEKRFYLRFSCAAVFSHTAGKPTLSSPSPPKNTAAGGACSSGN